MATRSRSTLVPRPLSIKESWDPLFRQPPMSEKPRTRVIRLERELKELKEVNKEARDWMGAVDQTLTRIKAIGGHNPTHQKTGNPGMRPSSPGPTLPSPPYLCPTNSRPGSPRVPTPTPSAPIRLQSPLTSQPTAPVVAYQTPVKDDGMGPPQSADVPNDQETLSFLLMNMKDTAGAWAHPHLDQLGSHRAIIQTVKDFRREFLSAFGNPDATRAAERQITNLTQTGTCAEYITKFRTIAMDLDWNDAALRGQLHKASTGRSAVSLPPENGAPQHSSSCRMRPWLLTTPSVRSAPATRLRVISLVPPLTPPIGGRVPANRPRDQAPLQRPQLCLREERNRRRAEGLCIKCGKAGHKFAECRTGWKATTKEEGVKKEAAKMAKNLDPNWEKIKVEIESPPSSQFQSSQRKQAEPLEVLIDSGATSSFLHPRTAEALRLPLIDLPTPRTVTMLNGVSRRHLRIEMVDAHNPEIDWNCAPSPSPTRHQEQVAIAEEEEADRNPLEGVPPKYHQYAKLTEEGPLNSPLYSMTDAESATLKDWLRDELKAGKIRPSKSSISSPVMFVPKKDGSRRLVVDYRRLNNRTRRTFIPYPDNASHTQHVHEVLRRLLENQLFCKASKCTFHVTSVEYLGIIVSDKGFSLDKLKIQAVQEWPTPTKVKEVQLFLGFANFLRRFVANFSHMAQPFTQPGQEGTPWKWDTREQEAFQGLKDAITNAPVTVPRRSN
ncbi:hypothetical protein RHS01_08592 [Rhizoctonia solani]|uniref:CCHC-type domain-containing protein n=1 Tax=Rhizoctonia solani TaxID=456999 RepID=A0A8H7I739_9AGAM|nr:hypothetical protein RHS01_08592 [Rhizoctonia solani]